MPDPIPTPANAPATYWPVDMSRVRLGPRFEGHHATPANPYRPNYGYHTGQDFFGPLGMRVVSMTDGVVVEASSHLTFGYGNCVLIYHPSRGCWSRYGHLDSMSVKTGDHVKAGQQIGRMGTSGTDNVHLHFDVIFAALPMTRFNPHNRLVGGVKHPLPGLDPVELALLRGYFVDPLHNLNVRSALNPATQKVVTI